MTQLQRPTYLSNVPDLSERATQGIGTVLPPHVSIRGNKFTLVDGAGNRKPVGDTLDFLVIDIADHTGKMFYKNQNWTPDSDDPPDCWSMNGVGPSRDAINPQARTCAECSNNVRGSRVSNMGSSIKACRDEVIVAIVVPAFPNLVFQMKITPGSFKNWRKHVEDCKGIGQRSGAAESVGTILTGAAFEPDVNGVLVFKAVSYPDEATWKVRTAALTAKATDLLVGRLDRPRELPAPTGVGQQIGASPDPNSAAFNPQAGQPVAISQQPAAQPEPAKRTRGRPRSQPEQSAQGQPALAPFRPDATPAQPNGGAPFGIQTAPNPSADIQASLDAAFGKPSGGTPGQGFRS